MKRMKRILALFLCVTTIVSFSTLFCVADASTLAEDYATKNQLESELKAIKKKQQEINASLKSAKDKVNNQIQTINLLHDEMEAYQKELETLSALIEEYTSLVAQKQQEIDDLNVKMNQNFELFKERLEFAQESGNMSYIDFILGSSDLSDIISRSEVINDMLENDRKIIESLISDRKAVEKAKEEIDLALKSCEEKQKQYEESVKVLEQKRAEEQAYLNQLKSDQAAQQAAYNRAQNSKKELEKRLDDIIQQIADKSTGSYAGDFIWPLPLSTPGYLTQKFKGSAHSGIDIGVGGWANNGKVPAIASAAGTVVRVGYWSDWGNLVVVDHGGKYLTYYAHLHTISVSYGQKVSQGQQLGKIGSTGDSSAPHLHFVFYAPVGAKGASIRTDPLNYVKIP